MIIPSPSSPFIFLNIRYYSIFMAIAILAGVFVSYFFSKKYFKEKVDSDILLDALPIVIISGILGARIYYVTLNFRYFIHNLSEIIKIQNGGISIHGAIIGGFLSIYFYFKKKKIKMLPYLDTMSFGLILAQAIGRMGNYFNQEAFGSPTDGFLKLYVTKNYRPLEFQNYDYFHPTFLYEIFSNILIFFILFSILKYKKTKKDGEIFLFYLIFYSIFRIIIENIRIDSILNILNIPFAQIMSVIIILVSCIFLFKIYKDDAF